VGGSRAAPEECLRRTPLRVALLFAFWTHPFALLLLLLLLRLVLSHLAGARLFVEIAVAHIARIHRLRGRALQPVAPARKRR
jgi:hypothetical protein